MFINNHHPKLPSPTLCMNIHLCKGWVVFEHQSVWVLPNHVPSNPLPVFLTLPPPICFLLCLECAKHPPTTGPLH